MDEKQKITTSPANDGIQQASTLTKEETRTILTPFAFEINKTLFGLPLAVPWKRALALLIDFIFIAILAETPGELLAFLVALTFFRLGSKKRAQAMGKKMGLRRVLLRFIGVIIIFVVLIDAVPPMFSADYWQSETVETTQTEVASTTDLNSSIAEETFYKGVEWSKGVIKDLGLSFGWAALYFSVLTAIWHGQTPGKRLLNIRVVQLDGTPLSVWDSFGRYGGYGAGLATGLLGFLQIYWDPNRQAIHDKISSTIVIDVIAAERLEHPAKSAGFSNKAP
ncbi:RDD family protein [Thalassotalea sediminis]|uniref:RDD family protein n=1 Tax=Thalassotalea sediminis TaxID=1759089 RepID=UPI002572420F|nr:RDD family protein [Thalassotalea sediminis]